MNTKRDVVIELLRDARQEWLEDDSMSQIQYDSIEEFLQGYLPEGFDWRVEDAG